MQVYFQSLHWSYLPRVIILTTFVYSNPFTALNCFCGMGFQQRDRNISYFIKNILMCSLKINESLVYLEQAFIDAVMLSQRKSLMCLMTPSTSQSPRWENLVLTNLFPDTSSTCSSVACESSGGMRTRRFSLTHRTFRLQQPPIWDKSQKQHEQIPLWPLQNTPEISTLPHHKRAQHTNISRKTTEKTMNWTQLH